MPGRNAPACAEPQTPMAAWRQAFLAGSGRDVLVTGADLASPDMPPILKSRLFFGETIAEAVNRGFLITRRAYLECSNGPVVSNSARILARAAAAPPNRMHPSMLEPFSGIGHNTWAFARAGFQVVAAEDHPYTFTCLQANLTKANVEGRVGCRLGDGMALLSACPIPSLSAVFLDPPWNGGYRYDLTRPFRLTDYAYPGAWLVERALAVAPVAALKAPLNIHVRSVVNLGAALRCSATLHYQRTAGRPREFGEALVVFVRGMKGFAVKNHMLPAPELQEPK